MRYTNPSLVRLVVCWRLSTKITYLPVVAHIAFDIQTSVRVYEILHLYHKKDTHIFDHYLDCYEDTFRSGHSDIPKGFRPLHILQLCRATLRNSPINTNIMNFLVEVSLLG